MESNVNSPHPDDPNPEDFFGGEGDEDAAAEATATADEPRAQEFDAGEFGGGEEATAEEPAPSEEPAGEEPEAPSEPEPAPAATQPSARRGYVVLQEMPLTEKVLKGLLEEAKNNGGGEVRVAYFKVQEVETRSAPIALREVYSGHRQALGDSPRLGAVAMRGWSFHTVRARPVRQEAIEIE